ncbi:MAG: hypothetical protein ACPGUY_00275 [Akkermansiaceae bacterium]
MTQFKFKWVDSEGDEEGFLRKKGSFDGQTLRLDSAEIPADAIASIETRANRAVIAVLTGEAEPTYLIIAVSGIAVKRLKGLIDVARSASWAKLEREELEKKGQGHLYREATCQHCHAVITLSRMAITPQQYCSFCDTLTTISNPASAPPAEKNLRLCDECGMFSMPKKFTIFYFYFLVVVYGYRQSTTWRCPGCMRGEAWKMFFGNLIFILGVPTAIIQLIRSYGGSVAGKFAGLDKANLLARKGRTPQALAIYRDILKRVPHSAGMNYNIGISLLETKPDLAVDSLERALDDCSNYSPAANVLAHCYEKTGQVDKLNELKAIWGEEEPEQTPQPSTPPQAPPPLPG